MRKVDGTKRVEGGEWRWAISSDESGGATGKSHGIRRSGEKAVGKSGLATSSAFLVSFQSTQLVVEPDSRVKVPDPIIAIH